MNSMEYSLVFFILVPHSFGRCFDVSFSICWMSREGALSRQNENLWLNNTSLKSIMTGSRMSSLSVSSVVVNRLSLQAGGSVHRWTVTISPRTKVIKITGRQKPSERPTDTTKNLLKVLSPTEVFACESGTTFLHQEENFFLAVGHTSRFPVKLESRSPSTLLVSWSENDPDDISSHTVTLYHVELGSYSPMLADRTALDHYRFTALEACSLYVVCVQISDSHSSICISTITDPNVPKDFEVSSWNSSSISLAWDCPVDLKFSHFLLTIIYLNGTGHVTEEAELRLTDETFAFTVSELPPCVRLKFGLQTVCQAGLESRYSRMVLNQGNSDYSNINMLRLTSFGPESYTLSWEVRNISSISMFRVYHEGALQATTLLTTYTVRGLLPCRRYRAKVEALCGDNVLMSVKTVRTHTGPGGVSQLRYRSDDSTAVWTPSTSDHPDVAFVYELSLENGPTVESGPVSHADLHLPGLEPGRSYVLDVWEECDGRWKSEPSQLGFIAANSSSEVHVRAAESNQNQGLQLDFDNVGLTLVVPWSLSEDLQEDSSESRAKMEQIYKKKLQELLKDFDQPVLIQLDSFEAGNDPEKTEIQFRSFDASETLLLPVDDQLNYISSLNPPNVSVRNGVLHWEGPDMCVEQSSCPPSSVCMNTLGSYLCVCRRGFYDVSSFIDPPAASHPVCKDKGLFNQCLDKVLTGGIAKAHLASLFEGNVEVKLNDGRCLVNESETLYYFHTPRRSSACGTVKQVNRTHFVLQNTLTVSLSKEHTITRRDLKVVWKCVYPRHYVRNAQVFTEMEWLTSIILVEFNSSLQLGLSMTLYGDESYTRPHSDSVDLGLEDTLFFQVALQTSSSFASEVLLRVESCWATESSDPMDTIQAAFLHEGCPVDNTFLWRSANGLSQTSRFSIQMFNMPKGLPLYFHCLTSICGHDEDCSQNCTIKQRSKRTVDQMDRKGNQAAVVSAGPLTVNLREKSVHHHWPEHMSVIIIVAAFVSCLGMVVLSLSAVKAVMMYHEQQQLE